MVLGVSPDSGASHAKFAGKYYLPFPLLADTDHSVSEKYGAWGEKSLYGRKFLGITRSTFLIGPVRCPVWPKVKVDGHVDQVLQAIREISTVLPGNPDPGSGVTGMSLRCHGTRC